MGRKPVLLTGKEIETVLRHVAETGAPLLREKRATDLYAIEAIPYDDGSFELTDGIISELPAEYSDWSAFARQCDEDLWHLVDILERRGYPGDIPSPDDDPASWPSMDPLEVMEFLGAAVQPSVVDRLRRIVPGDLRLGKTAKPFQFNPEVRVALGWLDGTGTPADAHDYELTGSTGAEPLVVAPTAVALSLLQVVLDPAFPPS